MTEAPIDFLYLTARQDPAIRTTLLVGVTNESGSVAAQPASVLRMVMRHGATLVAIGAVLGLSLTVAISGVLRGAFPSNAGVNLGVYALVVPLLLAVTLTAALLPAMRAARIDPLLALRQE